MTGSAVTGSAAVVGRRRVARLERSVVLLGPGLRELLARRVALGAVDDVADPQLPDDVEQGDDAGGDEDLADDADDRDAAARLLRRRGALAGAGVVARPPRGRQRFIHRGILVSAGCGPAGS